MSLSACEAYRRIDAALLTAQSKDHLRMRKPFTGCNAGHTFFHTDPHGLVSI
jgi:hypothetical protein